MDPARPNVVLVIVHDLGRHLGCYGVETVGTPNCDALAAAGVRFSQSFAVAPQCSPSRASLFTGRYPHQNGMIGLAHAPHSWDIHHDEVHLARSLHDAGYRTALIGFQHETGRPCEMGYDECDYRWHDSCENISRDAASWIRSRGATSEPYYLQVGIIEPHRHFDMYGGVPDDSRGVWVPPYLMPDDHAVAEFAAFQGAIAKMDAAIGRLFQAVAESDRGENTLLIFTTDHGIPFPKAKCSLYDAGLETALIASWPAGGWSGGRIVDGLVSNIDMMPTLLQACSAADRQQSRLPLCGMSFADLAPRRDVIFGEKTWHDYYDPMRCVRTATHKLIANFSTSPFIQDPSQSRRPLTTPQSPVNPLATHPDFELYDLLEDPYELRNIYDADGSAEIRSTLLRELARWCVTTDDFLVTDEPLSPRHRHVRSVLLESHGV